MKRNEFLKILAENGVFPFRNGSKHDIFRQITTGKKVAVPTLPTSPCKLGSGLTFSLAAGIITSMDIYLKFGTVQRLPGNRFFLQPSVTEAGTGVRKATFMQDGTLAQFERRGALLNEAPAELFGQMGVQLTEAGMQTLLAGNVSAVQAEAGLARGIIAQTGGAEVEAVKESLVYYG